MTTETTIEERVIRYEERYRLLFLAIDEELDIESLLSFYAQGLIEFPDDIEGEIEEIEAAYPGFKGTEEDIEGLPELDLEIPELEDLLSAYEDEISESAREYLYESAFLEVGFRGGENPDHVFFLITCGGPDIRLQVYVDEKDPIEVKRAELCYSTWGHQETATFSKDMAERLVDTMLGDDVGRAILRLKFQSWGGSAEDWNAASA